MGPDRSQPDAGSPSRQEKAAGNGERRGDRLCKNKCMAGLDTSQRQLPPFPLAIALFP